MSDHVVDFLPATDPLARQSRLDYAVEIPVIGIATRFETNSRFVIGIVEEAFGEWRGLERSPSDAPARLTVRITVREGNELGSAQPVHYCPDATRLIVHSTGSVGISDPSLHESVAYVTTSLVANAVHFRESMLEPLTLALLSHFDRHPLHAAAIVCGDRAVLLAGESGAGKSTLAYLAHRAGIDVLAEDHVWIQLDPTLRVWGRPGRARLAPETVRHFPELPSRATTSRVDDTTKLTVLLAAATPGRLVADEAVVCLLGRTDGNATLERIDAPEITSALTDRVAPGFDRFPDRHERVVRALASPRGWRLSLSTDPRQALPLLETMLRR